MHHEDHEPGVGLERTYTAKLRCPACEKVGSQILLRARQIVTLPVPGKAFLRAFGWAQGRPEFEDSPLYYGICLCSGCRYPGLESDFRPQPELAAPNSRWLHKLFLEEGAGRAGEIKEILGEDPAAFPPAERAIRVLTAAIRAEMLPYPELWRHQILGHLFHRLAWIYLDLQRLDWQANEPGKPPVYCEAGPNAGALGAILKGMETIGRFWPETPLGEESAWTGALRHFQVHYETRGENPSAEESVREEWRLARLYCVLGQDKIGREMYDRARRSAFRGRDDALKCKDEVLKGPNANVAEWRRLGNVAKRLVKVLEEVSHERRQIFGSPLDEPVPKRMARRTA